MKLNSKNSAFCDYDLQEFYILTVHNSIYSYTIYNRQKGSTIFGDKLMAYCNVNWSSGIPFHFQMEKSKNEIFRIPNLKPQA